MSMKFGKNSVLSKLMFLYFLEYPTIDFSQIKRMIKEHEKEIEKFKSFSMPSWLEGKAKDIALTTVNFIKNNIHLLTLSKKFYTYQEYQQLLKFKLALQNLDILAKEDKKVQSMSLRNNKRKTYRTSLTLLFIVILTFIIIFTESRNSNTVTYISFFLMVASMAYSLIVNLEFRQFFFSSKGADVEKEELEHQIDISSKKITKSFLF